MRRHATRCKRVVSMMPSASTPLSRMTTIATPRRTIIWQPCIAPQGHRRRGRVHRSGDQRQPAGRTLPVALGQVRIVQKRHDAAEGAFVSALSIDPSNGDAYTNLGACSSTSLAMRRPNSRYERR